MLPGCSAPSGTIWTPVWKFLIRNINIFLHNLRNFDKATQWRFKKGPFKVILIQRVEPAVTSAIRY